MLPYMEGVSEDIRHVCRQLGMKVVFRSGQFLHSLLPKVKDALTMEMSKVVYWVSCSCGEAYSGETVRWLKTRMKEHQDACQKGVLEKLALVEHGWESHHPIKWKETWQQHCKTVHKLFSYSLLLMSYSWRKVHRKGIRIRQYTENVGCFHPEARLALDTVQSRFLIGGVLCQFSVLYGNSTIFPLYYSIQPTNTIPT